jgi:hypothetical protein
LAAVERVGAGMAVNAVSIASDGNGNFFKVGSESTTCLASPSLVICGSETSMKSSRCGMPGRLKPGKFFA